MTSASLGIGWLERTGSELIKHVGMTTVITEMGLSRTMMWLLRRMRG